MSTRALTTYVGFTRDGALGFGPLAAPSSGGERRERTLGGQLTLGSYLGKAKLVLNESRFALSGVHTSVTPYQNIPAASVLVNSQIPDADVEISSLSLGGGSYLPADDSRWTVEIERSGALTNTVRLVAPRGCSR